MKNVAITLLVILMLTSVATLAENKSGGIDQNLLKKYQEKFENQTDINLRINALTANSVKALSLDHAKLLTHDRILAINLPSNGITNQRGTGRCWLFAALNVLTLPMLEKLDMESFELSQSYLSFYDKLEKANCFLEDIIAHRKKDFDDREFALVLQYPFGDGGWWPYATKLIKKYGVVPIDVMPETKQSSSTGSINRLTTTLLRGFASELRTMHKDGKNESSLRKRKEEMLADVYQLLVYTYGPPPEEFDFRYEMKIEENDDETDIDSISEDDTDIIENDAIDDDDEEDDDDDKPDKIWVKEHHTPTSFYEKYLAEFMNDFVLITNSPTQEFSQLYTLEGSRNIWDQDDVTVLNMPLETLREYTYKSLLDSQAVWFACDVGRDNYGDSGIFMVDIYDYQSVFNLDFSLTKTERLDYWDISPNHAMTIMGCDTSDAGQPTKWLVENSWGKKPGEGGRWYMYGPWFDEYVLMVVIDKNLLSDENRTLLEQKPIVIKSWQPFFLALRNLD